MSKTNFKLFIGGDSMKKPLIKRIHVPPIALTIVWLLFFGPGCGKPTAPQKTAAKHPSSDSKTAAATPEIVAFEGMAYPWSSPQPSDPTRLFRSEYGLYSALWDSRSEPAVVIVKNNPLTLTGANYAVWVVDHNGKALQRGTVVSAHVACPYCLVEIKTKSLQLPLAYRDRWILAVGLIQFSDNPPVPLQFTADFPVRFFTGNLPHIEGVNLVDVEPILWNENNR